MRINAENLKSIVKEAGISVEDLARSLPGRPSTTKGQAEAQSAVRNWMSGKNHPRAKAAEIVALASALGTDTSTIAKYTAQFRWCRSSERKTGLVVDLIRGKSVPEAINLLDFSPKRASWQVKKALSAAVAEAEQNDAAVDRLFVSEARVDKGITIKRFQPKDRGRAHPIQKRTCHITVSVEEEGL